MVNIESVLLALFHIFVFPGFLFVSFAGLLLAGIDRKILARMQKRIGPPIIQPMYDFFKLMGKETIVPHAAHKPLYLASPVIGFLSLLVLALFIPIFGFTAFGGNGVDLIVVLYLLTIPAVSIMLGASASSSQFAGIGLSREMVTMMAYELPLILVFLSVAKVVGGDHMDFSLAAIGGWQWMNGCLIAHWSLIPAAIAMLLVIPAEVGTHPFDAAEAETEICEGTLVEYSGAPLAIYEMNTAIKMFIMTSLFTFLFFGGITYNTGTPALDVFLYAVTLLAICIGLTIVCMTTVHAVCARLKIEHLFKFYWTIVSALALLSLILAWCGL